MVLSLGVVAPAWATPLPPGGSVTPATISFSVPKGSVLASATINYTFGPGQNGTLREEVINVGGKLDFLYQVTQTGKGVTTLSTGSSFKGTNLDVFQAKTIGGAGVKFNTGNAQVNPETRSADGASVTFNFSPSVKNQNHSYIQILETNSVNFTKGSLTLTSSSGATTSIPGLFVPVAVPEPATIVLWCALFGGVVLVATRKKWMNLARLPMRC
jgi:hypothetical protein